MKYGHLRLEILPQTFKYVLLKDKHSLPLGDELGPIAMFMGHGEVSAIVPETLTTDATAIESDWACIRVVGEMPFGSVQGLIAKVSAALHADGLGVCIVSTFKSDWFFVRMKYIERARSALSADGWEFQSSTVD